jgi:hypothetical protein
MAGRLQRRLNLLQPEGHVHLAVHGRRGGQVTLRRWRVAAPTVELAEAKTAVGDQRAQVEALGRREGLTIVAFGLVSRQWARGATGPVPR